MVEIEVILLGICGPWYVKEHCPSASFESYLKDTFFSAIFKNPMLVRHPVLKSAEETETVLVQSVHSYFTEERQCTSHSHLLCMVSSPTMDKLCLPLNNNVNYKDSILKLYQLIQLNFN